MKGEEKTVFVVCTKDTDSILYVFSSEKDAYTSAERYEDRYGTPCVVFEELLRSEEVGMV